MSEKNQPPFHKTVQSTTRGSVDNSAEPHFLAVGRIVRPHGVNGEVRVELLTDNPERFEWLDAVYVGEKSPRLVTIDSVRYHQNAVLLKLSGYPSRTEAEELRGELLLVPESEAVPLEDDEYFLHQIIGIEVVTEEGNNLGRLTEILETGANNVFVVKGAGREVLIPDIPDVIKDVDLENNRMVIHALPGLIDLGED